MLAVILRTRPQVGQWLGGGQLGVSLGMCVCRGEEEYGAGCGWQLCVLVGRGVRLLSWFDSGVLTGSGVRCWSCWKWEVGGHLLHIDPLSPVQ